MFRAAVSVLCCDEILAVSSKLTYTAHITSHTYTEATIHGNAKKPSNKIQSSPKLPPFRAEAYVIPKIM